MSEAAFIPVPDAAFDAVGDMLSACIYGAVWRLAQVLDGQRCVAPVELIGRTVGVCGTTARRKVQVCVRAGLLRREGNSVVIMRQLLDPHDPDIAELIRQDRARGFGRCVACGSAATQMDHRTPRSRGGETDAENLQPMCAGCNADKGSLTMDEWQGLR